MAKGACPIVTTAESAIPLPAWVILILLTLYGGYVYSQVQEELKTGAYARRS